ncbi:membrane-bound serine protease (ClpP class) [Granulicella rosea]|uniref:Membrane-bound serine protease (ClpP class) n=1 Tax=Granulicella rosea TaxID=474952 RepID=A0A239L3E9_9BACT|nr:NfeD family protein [Granulicella rosea]SNT24981.1 membrane-bound serine protease (ClpP class) [Granulicella rosea]
MRRLAALLTMLLLCAAVCLPLAQKTAVSAQTVQTDAAPFVPAYDVPLQERVATRLAHPNLDVLLIVAGLLLLYLEFNIPGAVVPGALGVLAMLLGIYGLSRFPLQPSAIVLVLVAFVLIGLELKLASHGSLAFLGTLALVFGLDTLIPPAGGAQVDASVAWGAGIGFGVISFWLGWIALRARRNKTLLGPQAMLGKLAVARTALAPTGQVEIRGELWQAALRDGSLSLPAGAAVLIREIDGLTLVVEPTP